MTAFLQGRQRVLYAFLAAGVRNADTPINLAVRAMNDAARQLQAYTRLGFPIALGSDATLSSLLFGQFAIPVNMADELELEATFNVAFSNYTCTDPVGAPCFGGVFSPLRGQPFLETLGEAPSPVVCRVPTTGTGLPGDQVGNCLVGVRPAARERPRLPLPAALAGALRRRRTSSSSPGSAARWPRCRSWIRWCASRRPTEPVPLAGRSPPGPAGEPVRVRW